MTGNCLAADVMVIMTEIFCAWYGQGQKTSVFIVLQDSNKARFVSAICDLESVGSKQEEGWVPCDPLAVAAALDSSIITGAIDVLCRVEIKNPDKRGQTYFHNLAEELKTSEFCGYMVSKVTKVDTNLFSAMMKVSTDD